MDFMAVLTILLWSSPALVLLPLALILRRRRYLLDGTGPDPRELSDRTSHDRRLPDQMNPFRRRIFQVREDHAITARIFGSETAAQIVIMVQHAGSASDQRNETAGHMASVAEAQVIAIDLGGHGESVGISSGPKEFGQYECDLRDLVEEIQAERPQSRIWLAGHSTCGETLLRFALLRRRPKVAGFILLAPVYGSVPTVADLLTGDGPVQLERPDSLPRMIWNLLRVSLFKHPPVAVLHRTPDHRGYSFTAIASALSLPPLSMRDCLMAMSEPFIIMIGDRDNLVRPEGFAESSFGLENGCLHVLEDHTHESLLKDPETYFKIRDWMNVHVQDEMDHANHLDREKISRRDHWHGIDLYLNGRVHS